MARFAVAMGRLQETSCQTGELVMPAFRITRGHWHSLQQRPRGNTACPSPDIHAAAKWDRSCEIAEYQKAPGPMFVWKTQDRRIEIDPLEHSLRYTVGYSYQVKWWRKQRRHTHAWCRPRISFQIHMALEDDLAITRQHFCCDACTQLITLVKILGRIWCPEV
jgi:hypothetical protein